MKFLKRIMNWFVAATLLLTGLNLSTALAEDAPVKTVTVNVTNTPVRGDVLLERPAYSWCVSRMNRTRLVISS